MKRIVSIGIALALVLAVGMSFAYAETMEGGDWYVHFTAGAKMESNFSLSAMGMADVLSELQPGDDAIFYMRLQNQYPADTDWYMTNEVLQSLEASQSVAENGAYTYDLRYVSPDGVEDVLYSSSSVGGEGKTLADRIGLREATSALEDFFYLDTLSNGETANITLRVALDGETQGNVYQDTLARLQMNFAVELPESSGRPGTWYTVRTGDEVNMLLWSGVMMLCGMAALALGACTMRKNRQGRRNKHG